MQRMKMIQKLVRFKADQAKHIQDWADHLGVSFCDSLRLIVIADMGGAGNPCLRPKKRKEAGK